MTATATPGYAAHAGGTGAGDAGHGQGYQQGFPGQFAGQYVAGNEDHGAPPGISGSVVGEPIQDVAWPPAGPQGGAGAGYAGQTVPGPSVSMDGTPYALPSMTGETDMPPGGLPAPVYGPSHAGGHPPQQYGQTPRPAYAPQPARSDQYAQPGQQFPAGYAPAGYPQAAPAHGPGHGAGYTPAGPGYAQANPGHAGAGPGFAGAGVVEAAPALPDEPPADATDFAGRAMQARGNGRRSERATLPAPARAAQGAVPRPGSSARMTNPLQQRGKPGGGNPAAIIAVSAAVILLLGGGVYLLVRPGGGGGGSAPAGDPEVRSAAEAFLAKVRDRDADGVWKLLSAKAKKAWDDDAPRHLENDLKLNKGDDATVAQNYGLSVEDLRNFTGKLRLQKALQKEAPWVQIGPESIQNLGSGNSEARLVNLKSEDGSRWTLRMVAEGSGWKFDTQPTWMSR